MQPPSKVQRIFALDLIRGYLLLAILINHLHRFPGFFDIFSGRGALWTSAAEGFFLISGVLTGLVRGNEVKHGLWRRSTKKLITRGIQLYVIVISLTVIYTLIGLHFVNNPGLIGGIMHFSRSDFRHQLWQILTFGYNYDWANFLQYYCVYLLVAPLAFWALSKRQWLGTLVLSIILFMFRNSSSFLIWQVYFFLGLVAGYHWDRLKNHYDNFSSMVRYGLTAVLYLITVLSLALDIVVVWVWPFFKQHNHFGLSSMQHFDPLMVHLQNLSSLERAIPYGGGRLIISILWLGALYKIVRDHEQGAIKKLGTLLLPIGQNPLLVYCFESAIIFSTNLAMRSNTGFLINLLIDAVAIFLTWLVASCFSRYKYYRKLRSYPRPRQPASRVEPVS